MDAIQLLTDQHRMLEERLDAALASGDPRERAALAAEAGDQLAIHVAAEEEVFHPALRAHRPVGIDLDALDDHATLKKLLAELIGRGAGDPTYTATLAALRAQVERHHADEEALLFAYLARTFDAAQREAMGSDILAYQKTLLRAGQPRCATRTLPPSPTAVNELATA